MPGKPSRMLSMSVPEKPSPRATPTPMPEQGYEGGLDQEHQPYLTPLEAQGPHHPDLLAPLDHRAGGDHAQSADADHEPEAHEAPQEQEDDPAASRRCPG